MNARTTVSACASLLALSALPLAAAAAALADDPLEWKSRRTKDPVAEWEALEGEPAPALDVLTDWLNTDELSWESLRGNVVLIDMWGTWCPPCVAAVPHMKKLHEKLAEDGLVVLAVHSKKNLARFASYVEQQELPYAVAADSTGAFTTAVKLKFWPSYFIVDRDGKMRIAGVSRGKDESGEAHMDIALHKILAEPWEGERKVVEYKRKAPAKPDAPEPKAPEVKLGANGWPAYVEKEMHAKNDLRGKRAPKLEVETWLSEKPDFAGKVVLVDFWATWCGPCVAGMPKMQEYHEKFGDDLVIVGISDQHPDAINRRTGEVWGPVVTDFLAKRDFTYPQALDGKARAKSALGVSGIPHVMIYSSDGIVRWQGFPGSAEDPLIEGVVAKIIEMDKKRPKDL